MYVPVTQLELECDCVSITDEVDAPVVGSFAGLVVVVEKCSVELGHQRDRSGAQDWQLAEDSAHQVLGSAHASG